MKVLVFMTQFVQRGGAEKLGVELAEGLNAHGIHTDILSQYSRGLAGVIDSEVELSQKGIPAVRYLDMDVHPSLGSSWAAALRLRRLIQDQGYEIVETSSAMPTSIAAWAVRGTNARVVAGLHQVFRRDRENSRKHKLWRASVRLNPDVRYYAISEYVAQAWIDYAGVSPNSVSVIYNGICDEAFKVAPDRPGVRAGLGIPEQAKLALFVGRLASYKGVDTVLEALGPISERHNLHILYAGWPDLNVEGTSHVLTSMKEMAEQAPWGDRVHYLGRRNDIPHIMAASDVLVHPARMEGFGLVLVEALATGLPVVASDVEAIPEILAGTHSAMVPPDDIAGFRDAVVRVLERPSAEAYRAAETGRLRAESFRSTTRTDALISLFDQVVREH